MAHQQHGSRGGGKGAGAGGGAAMEAGGGGAGRRREDRAWRAVAAGVAAAGLAGAGVLVWWAVAFHPAREQLWMVPVGLVLLGTPLLAWLSLFASGRLRHADDAHQQPQTAPLPSSMADTR